MGQVRRTVIAIVGKSRRLLHTSPPSAKKILHFIVWAMRLFPILTAV
jgi:hypothetical protein